MALPSVSYTFSNGTTSSATQVNQNFTDLINALTNTTKSLSIDALTCAGAVSFGTTLAVTGAATLSSTLALTGAATLSSTLAVTGNTTVGGTFGVTGATTLSSTLAVTGATTLSSTLGVTGIASFNNTTNSTSSSDGAVIIAGGVGIAKKLFVGSATDVTGATTLRSTLDILGSLSSFGASASAGHTARWFNSSNDARLEVSMSSTQAVLESTYGSSAGYKPMIFKTGGATALTIDTSQGATVAGATVLSSTLAVTGVTTLSARLKTAGRASAISSAKTSNYTATSNDETIAGDSSSGTFTFTLPAANAVSGQRLKFIKVDSSMTAITIARAGSDTIQGATSTKLATQYETVELISDGTATWYILDRNYPRSWTGSVAGATWTPTGSWVTNCTYTGQWRRVGDSAHFRVSIALGGSPGTPGALTVNLPSGFTIDTAKLVGTVASPTPHLRSSGNLIDAGLAIYNLTVAYNSTTSVLVRTNYTATIAATGSSYSASNMTDVTHTVPISPGSSDEVTIEFEVPIVGWS
jgi:fibronectin-binding autotransporter adhesin